MEAGPPEQGRKKATRVISDLTHRDMLSHAARPYETRFERNYAFRAKLLA